MMIAVFIIVYPKFTKYRAELVGLFIDHNYKKVFKYSLDISGM